MTAHDIMILAYPVIGAAAMIVASLVAFLYCGYHKPTKRPVAATSRMRAPEAPLAEGVDNIQIIERVLLSLDEAELRYIAKRSSALAYPTKVPKQASEA